MTNTCKDNRIQPTFPIHATADLTIESSGRRMRVTATGSSVVLNVESLKDGVGIIKGHWIGLSGIIVSAIALDRLLVRAGLSLCIQHHRLPVVGKRGSPILLNPLKRLGKLVERKQRGNLS